MQGMLLSCKLFIDIPWKIFLPSPACQANMLRIFLIISQRTMKLLAGKNIFIAPSTSGRWENYDSEYRWLLNDVGVCLVGFAISRRRTRGCWVVKRITIVTLKPSPGSTSMTHARESCIPSPNQPIFAVALNPSCHDKLKITNKQWERGSPFRSWSPLKTRGWRLTQKSLFTMSRVNQRQGWCCSGFVQFNLSKMVFLSKYLVRINRRLQMMLMTSSRQIGSVGWVLILVGDVWRVNHADGNKT